GLDEPSYSNGAVWADLNNDGALDMIVNNIDGKAFVYENTANNNHKANNHWIEVKFRGNKKNTLGLDATADIYYDHGQKHQTYYNTLYRGYLSSVQDMAHFGLGKYTNIDSLVISWPDQKKEVWENIKADQILTAKEHDAKDKNPPKSVFKKLKQKPFFTDVTQDRDVRYVQKENKFNDFHLQGVLPHKFSQYGPGLAVGDVDGNGEEDLFIGGSYHHKGKFLLQQKDGKFVLKDMLPGKSGNEKSQEDEGVLFFDANNDGLPDLFIVSGSDENPQGSKNYEDRLYINEGHGRFKYAPNALPPIHESGSCVKAADYNHDGYLDLFVGGRAAPGHYPSAVTSHILRNDTKNGQVKFTDVTKSIAKPLIHIGLVTDALWTDFNNDGWPDLIVSGEWMPVTFLENEHGKFVNITKKTGIGDKIGWWNSIVGGDFNDDGRTDYIVGNLGLNSLYKASDKYPVSIYANDFAHNGLYEAIITQYYPDSNGKKKEYPVERKDVLAHQLLQISHKFTTDHSFGKATIHDILNKNDLKNALTYHANMFQTCLIENEGHGKFSIKPLPIEAQFAPVFGMITGDFNNDGHLDVVLNGNESGIEPQIGDYDAFNGLLLLGNGHGKFTSEPMDKSGIYIPGDGKALVKLIGAKGNILMTASQNQGPLKMYRLNEKHCYIHLKREDAYAIIHYKNGSIRKEEFYYGSSFLSDSGRFMSITAGMKSVTIVNYKGKKRKITFN
ncbi:MAG TPA: FG-GAP-like repeat-containing protein, partial [Balneolales bacterium]|nr:FG-GAP-like repeat-containing protein [Balneolales bacterium]